MVGELLPQQFCRDPSSHEAKAGSFFCRVAFKRKAPLVGAGLIKSAPGGGSGTGGAERESNISLDKLAANYADIPSRVGTAERRGAVLFAIRCY